MIMVGLANIKFILGNILLSICSTIATLNSIELFGSVASAGAYRIEIEVENFTIMCDFPHNGIQHITFHLYHLINTADGFFAQQKETSKIAQPIKY